MAQILNGGRCGNFASDGFGAKADFGYADDLDRQPDINPDAES